MYAIIETGGKQYRVSAGDQVFVEKLNANENDTVEFDKVIAVSGEDGMKVGAPYVEGAVVKGSARKLGHRQPYTKVRIETINA